MDDNTVMFVLLAFVLASIVLGIMFISPDYLTFIETCGYYPANYTLGYDWHC